MAMFGSGDTQYKILTALQAQIHDLIEQNIKLQERMIEERKVWTDERKQLLDRLLAYQNAPLAVKLKQAERPEVVTPRVEAKPRFPGFAFPNAQYPNPDKSDIPV